MASQARCTPVPLVRRAGAVLAIGLGLGRWDDMDDSPVVAKAHLLFVEMQAADKESDQAAPLPQQG